LRSAFWLALFVSLTGCDAFGIEPARQIELAGEWDWIDDRSLFPKSCGSDTTFVYDSNGSFTTWGYAGTWSLDGDVFTITTTDFDPLHVDVPPEEIGKPYVSTLHWIDPNTFVTRNGDGVEMTHRRCPAPIEPPAR